MDLASVVAALASVGVRVSGSAPNSSVQVDSSRACPPGLAGPEPSGTIHDLGQHFQPDLGSFSVPDGSVPGSAPTHKDPNVQVRALFGTDKLGLETLDPETRQVIKDLLKRPVFRGDWATFEPEWDRYRGF